MNMEVQVKKGVAIEASNIPIDEILLLIMKRLTGKLYAHMSDLHMQVETHSKIIIEHADAVQMYKMDKSKEKRMAFLEAVKKHTIQLQHSKKEFIKDRNKCNRYIKKMTLKIDSLGNENDIYESFTNWKNHVRSTYKFLEKRYDYFKSRLNGLYADINLLTENL